jgi:hypothetical protein
MSGRIGRHVRFDLRPLLISQGIKGIEWEKLF